MLSGRIFCLLLIAPALHTWSQSPVSQHPPESKSSIQWLQQAYERMDLRAPGATSFHMTVHFHAFPGNELQGAFEKSQMITGDGIYEENWIAPHKWRREVSIGGYHAVEAESEKGRQFQAVSNYEPSRVLMLTGSLLVPIPRNYRSKEFAHLGANGWVVRPFQIQGAPAIQVTRTGGNQAGQATDAYYLTQHGLLVMSTHLGLITTWEEPFLYDGKAVPKRITVKAGADRLLLQADIAIEPVSQADPKLFEISAEPAGAGMTLRPLSLFEIRGDLSMHGALHGFGSRSPNAFTLSGVVDRTGRYREVEVILPGNGDGVQQAIELMKSWRSRPLEMDGSPCQILMVWPFVG